jgi:lipid-A-disaccharide synthase
LNETFPHSVREIIFVAGEASGDLHAGAVAEQLKKLRPDLSLVGVGGGHMERAGVELIHYYSDLAIMGFVEVIKHIPKHAALLKRLRERIQSGRVAAVVLIDYPGFNMKVAQVAREAGVPVVYYVTPQVWAWGAGRLPKMAKVITKAAVILPFEESLLRGYGIDATFVGHPLLDRATNLPTREEARRRLGLNPDDKVLALFPGSREQEIVRHWRDFIATGEEMVRRRPGLRVIVSGAPTIQIGASDSPFPVKSGASFDILRAADVALCKSGTTTLEAAISECPMALGYRTGGISYMIARRVVKIPYIGLVNVVAGREIAREFIQGALQPKPIADELERLLDDVPYRASVIDGLREVREKLGTSGASGRVASIIDSVTI